MRTKTEVELLGHRQSIYDAISYMQSLQIVHLEQYKYLYTQLETCNFLINEYRKNYKILDVGS